MATTSRIRHKASWTNLMPWVWRVPGISERVAAQLFVTPFGKLHPDECVLPRAPGESLTLYGQRRTHVRVYGEGSPVYVVHGWGGEGRQMSGFVDPLVARGHQVVLFDLPAHGESEGAQTNVLEASDALLAAERRFGQPVGVIAHSFGAAVTVLAQQRGLRADALVFIAPMPSMELGVEQFAVRAQLPLVVLDKASRLIEESVGLSRKMICIEEVGSQLRTPLLLIHDREDRAVSVEHSQAIAAAWPGARLLQTSGLGHRRVLRDDAVLEHAAAFLEQGTVDRVSELEARLCCE